MRFTNEPMKKFLIILFALGVALVGCSQEKNLTENEKKLIEAKEFADQVAEIEKQNKKIEAEVNAALKEIMAKATVKEVVDENPFGESEKQWQYTMTNSSKYTFESVQLQWDEYTPSGKKDGENYSEPIENIKPGQTFTVNARLSAGTTFEGIASYKNPVLHGNPIEGTYKDMAE